MGGHYSGAPGHAPAGAGGSRLRLVFWETTAGCNLECIHCRRLEVARERMRDDLSTEEALALVESIARAGKPILVLSGGEPLLRPDLFTVARHAVGQGLVVSMASNGTLITPQVAGQVRDAGIRRVSISIDGADAATHDTFRALPGSFDAALRGLGYLRDAGVEVQINTTIARHNAEQLAGIYELARTVGAVAFHAFMLVPVGCGVQIADDQMLSPARYEEILNEFYDLSRRGELQLKATCAPHYYRIARQRARAEGIAPSGPREGMAAMTRGCLAGTAVCFVSHKGQVFPCGYLPVEAGNVRTRDFAEIWRESPLFRTLREDALGGKCGACEYRTVCGGCRARAYYATGDFLAEEPYCSYLPQPRG
ncbi:MAG TPA: radical SAM protein [Armatimonadota bacterium]|nr:radical SAM protein [Armatimonadota bacterium]HOJ20593.1 radical SAM protein [Armatimonadota bacterium]HPT96350.1 radical SAM protein [Armatimonadota bacterium]